MSLYCLTLINNVCLLDLVTIRQSAPVDCIFTFIKMWTIL